MRLGLLIFLLLFMLKAFSNDPVNKSISETNTNSISGSVTDMITGEGLTGVKVLLLENNTTVYTDFNGNFSFQEIASGDYTISIEYISYKKNVVNKVSPGKHQIIKLRSESGPNNIRLFAVNRDA